MLAALTAVAALAAGPSGPMPDPGCPGCIVESVLVAVPVAPWTTDQTYDQKFFHALPPDCVGLTANECKFQLNPAVHGGGYWDDGVGITVEPVLLSDVTHPDGKPLRFTDHDVLMTVFVALPNARTTYDLDKLRVSHCGPKGTETPSFHVGLKDRVVDGHHIVNAAVIIQTDPATITTCTLDFSHAIRSSTGKIIPPLAWKTLLRYFPELIP